MTGRMDVRKRSPFESVLASIFFRLYVGVASGMMVVSNA